MNLKWRMQEFFNNIRDYFSFKRENRMLKRQASGEDKESRMLWILVIAVFIFQAFWGVIFISQGFGERFTQMREVEKNIFVSLDNLTEIMKVVARNKKAIENLTHRLNLLNEIEEQNAKPFIMDIF